MKCWFVRFYPELLLFYDEDKALIVVRVEVAHLHRRLLLLPNPLSLPVQQLDLNVRIWRERKACVLEKEEKNSCSSKSPDPGYVYSIQQAPC